MLGVHWLLNISERISIIESLLDENTSQSLTYAALESRLTLENLCYERFKLSHPYLSTEDLKNWQPKHIVKQVSEEIDENINKEFTVSVCKHSPGEKTPKTKEDFESLEYKSLGKQSALNVNKLHRYWNALSNVALHIQVPNIKSGEINIYGNNEQIKKKIEEVLVFLSTIDGNLLMGGALGKVFSFNCQGCEFPIKKPIEYLCSPSVVNCINPKCNESYLIEPNSNGEFDITRRVMRFPCKGCENDLEVITNTFNNFKFQQQLNIRCGDCGTSLIVRMLPLIKEDI